VTVDTAQIEDGLGLISAEKVRAERCRRSLEEFTRTFWHVSSAEDLKWNWHMSFLCTELEKVLKRVFRRQPKEYDLIINIPPGTSKTTLCTIMLNAWAWATDPTLRFITGSYQYDLSVEQAIFTRDIVRDPLYRKWYPYVIIKRDQDLKGNFKTTKTGQRYVASVGSAVMGEHAHVIAIDDPINPKQAASDLELGTANAWMDYTLPTRKVDKAMTPMILIMQRLHEDDPTGHLLEKEKEGIRHICLPAEVSDDVLPPECKEEYVDGLLDPVRLSRPVLDEAEKDLGGQYEGQFNQRPVPEGGGMFPVDKLVEVLTPHYLDVVQSVRFWDKAISEQETACLTAGVLIHRMNEKFPGPKFIISHAVAGRWAEYKREETIRQCAIRDNERWHGSAEVWLEQEPGSAGVVDANASIANLAGFMAQAERATGDKVTRARPLAAQVQIGNVGYVDGPWVKEWKHQLAVFPRGKLKDYVDATSGGFGALIGGMIGGTWGKRTKKKRRRRR